MTDPLRPKPRDPLANDNAFDKAQGTKRWAWLYVAVAVTAAVAAAIAHLVYEIGLMQPQVLFPSLGAVWFGFRALYAFTGVRR